MFKIFNDNSMKSKFDNRNGISMQNRYYEDVFSSILAHLDQNAEIAFSSGNPGKVARNASKQSWLILTLNFGDSEWKNAHLLNPLHISHNMCWQNSKCVQEHLKHHFEPFGTHFIHFCNISAEMPKRRVWKQLQLSNFLHFLKWELFKTQFTSNSELLDPSGRQNELFLAKIASVAERINFQPMVIFKSLFSAKFYPIPLGFHTFSCKMTNAPNYGIFRTCSDFQFSSLLWNRN